MQHCERSRRASVRSLQHAEFVVFALSMLALSTCYRQVVSLLMSTDVVKIVLKSVCLCVEVLAVLGACGCS